MSSNYPIADVLSAVKNIKNRYIKRVTQVPYSVFAENLMKLLQENGYILSYEVQEVRKNVRIISVLIRFDMNGLNVISAIKFYSKPSRRFYVGVDELRFINAKNKAGLVVVSTTGGLRSGSDALKAGVGGELICVVL